MSGPNLRPLLDATRSLPPRAQRLNVAVIFDRSVRADTTGTHCLMALSEICNASHLAPAELPRVAAGTYDLFVYIDDGLTYAWPQHLRPAVFWAIDTHLQYAAELAKGRSVDLVFTAQRNGALRMRDDGVQAEWLPLAANPHWHRRASNEELLDWSFVGNGVTPERVDLLNQLAQAFPLHIAGNAYGDDLSKVYSSSRAVVNRSVRDDVNMRVFEAMACGALLLTDRLSTESGMDLLFAEHEHFLGYSSIDEAVDQLRWSLEHPDERRVIARRGHSLVHAQHTYRHRMSALLENCLPILRSNVSATPPASASPNYYEYERPEVIAMIPTSARRVLELGCASGALAAALKRRQSCHVTGIEYVETAAQRAATRLDRVITGDCETLDFDALFQPGEFDCVVAADVLEHLRDPETVLGRLKPFLSHDATIVTSIPNIRNAGVLRSAVEGNWTYQEAGILDRTHLRFFTRREIDNMFSRLGYELDEQQSVDDPGIAEWVRLGKPANVSFGPLVLNGLPADEVREFFVIQWLTRSRVVAPVTTPIPERPKVSIVVLTYNQIEYTRQCVDSLIAHTRQPYELILVDNGSRDGTPEYLRSIAGAKVILNSENLGYAAGNNLGIAVAEGDYIVLLNNDAIVTEGWLDRLVAPMERDRSIGFVGPRSNYVAGAQLLTDIPYSSTDGLAAFAAERARAYAGQGSPTAFVVGFCLVLRREVAQRIGGLDPVFGSGNFEDNDYCLRAILAGWSGWIADDVFVHHYGHRTFIGENIDWQRAMYRNAGLFAEKWGLERAVDTGAPIYPDDFLSVRRFEPSRDMCPLPNDVRYLVVTDALAAYFSGVQLLQAGKAAEAITSLRSAVERSPEVADFHNVLGAALFEAGQIEDGIAELNRALELAPDDAAIRANLEDAMREGKTQPQVRSTGSHGKSHTQKRRVRSSR